MIVVPYSWQLCRRWSVEQIYGARGNGVDDIEARRLNLDAPSERYLNTAHLIRDQCIAMIEYATGRGIAVPADAPRILEASLLEPLQISDDVVELHNKLAQLVAPARPHAINLLMNQLPPWGYLTGELRVLGWMVVALVVSLIGFIVLAMNQHVTATTLDIDYLELNGWPQFYVLLFVTCAAALGSSIANLFKIYQYVTDAQFERRYEISYWIRFILGIAAGLILAELVSQNLGENFTKPLIAILGGFAARVVEDVLNRLVETLRTLVHGNTEALIRSRAAALEAEYEQQRIKEEARKLKGLMALKSELAGSEDSAEATEMIDRLIEEFSQSRPIRSVS